MTRDLGFHGLIRRVAQFSLLRLRWGTKYLFYSRSPQGIFFDNNVRILQNLFCLFLDLKINSESSDFVLDTSGKYVQYDNVSDSGYKPTESPVPDSARSSPVSVGNASVGKNNFIYFSISPLSLKLGMKSSLWLILFLGKVKLITERYF